MTGRAAARADRLNAVSSLLVGLSIPDDAEEPDHVPDLQPSKLPDLYCVLVSVCHQTSPKGEPALAGTINGQLLRGWDYLRQAFLLAAQRDPSFLDPHRLSVLTAADLNDIIQIADSPVYLNSLEHRASLIRDIGTTMQRLALFSVTDLFIRCDGFLINPAGRGLLSEMGQFQAYRDPVMKKTVYFLALMQNQKLWTLRDPQHLPAPVDYHEVRGHLRMGTVVLQDAYLAARVGAGESVSQEDDILIRRAVAEAIASISAATGLTQSRLHYLFWNVFRNCCKRDVTHCDGCPSDCSLPDRYKTLTAEARQCVFSSVCQSRGQADKLVEHDTRTDFY